jgi:hypothetical protein
MTWKIIVFLAVLVVALLFIGFNLGNRTDISIGVYVWRDVPVFLSMFFSFAFGALSIVPFLLKIRFSRKGRKKAEPEHGTREPPRDGAPAGTQPPQT